MDLNTFTGIIMPFIGTSIGAAFVFFTKDEMSTNLRKALLGFASGIMIAASVWSLLIPAIEILEEQEVNAWLQPAIGFLLGIVFLLVLDKLIPHLHASADAPEGVNAKLRKSTMLAFALALHNIPEGMAVGVAFAGVRSGNLAITLGGAFVLAAGIAIHNLPEGAVISMSLGTSGISKIKAFLIGSGSGLAEPLFAIITIALTTLVVPILPVMLSFAAGAMIYVVVEELIPDAMSGKHSDIPTLAVAFGFLLMMILEVALG